MKSSRRRQITLVALGLAWVALLAIAENPEGAEFTHRMARRALAGTDAIDPFFLCQRFFGGMRGDYDTPVGLRPWAGPPPRGMALAMQSLVKGIMVTVEGVRAGGWPAFLPALISLGPGLLITGSIFEVGSKKTGDGVFGTLGCVWGTAIFLALTLLIGGVIALALKWTLHGVFWTLGASATLVVYASPLILAIGKIRELVETGGKVRELATLVTTPDSPDEVPRPASPGEAPPPV